MVVSARDWRVKEVFDEEFDRIETMWKLVNSSLPSSMDSQWDSHGHFLSAMEPLPRLPRLKAVFEVD